MDKNCIFTSKRMRCHGLLEFFGRDDSKYPGDVESKEDVTVKPVTGCFSDNAFHVFPH